MPNPNQPFEIDRAMRSGARRGIVGADRPMAYKAARTLILPHHTILDFGAGKWAQQTQLLRQDGFNVTAHDRWAGHPDVPGLHDPNALDRQYDVVMAGNVLNVQKNSQELATVLNQIKGAVKPTGFAIVALTDDPRYDAFRGMTLAQGNQSVEDSLRRRFREVEHHPLSNGRAPLWICRRPRN